MPIQQAKLSREIVFTLPRIIRTKLTKSENYQRYNAKNAFYLTILIYKLTNQCLQKI